MSDIKTIPTAGYRYDVKRGDTSSNVERAAYGYVTGLIEGANPFILHRNKDLQNRPFLYPTDIIYLPANPGKEELKTERAKRQLSGKDKNEITIIINDKEITYLSARILRVMDAVSDTWSASLEWEPGRDRELDAILIPYSYPKAQVYIGNELIINGLVYGHQFDYSNSGTIVTIEGFSFAADIIDSTMPIPYEAKKITLEDRANQLLVHIGIKAEFAEGVDKGGIFDRVTGEETETIFNHLAKLAGQRGLLISSTPEGNIIFLQTTTSKSVGTIEPGIPSALSYGSKFDGRQLFNQVTAIGESPGGVAKKSTVNDSNIPRSRFMTFQADDTTDGDIEKAAEWKRTKQYADALTIPVPIEGLYAPDGKIWKENTIVTLKNPNIFIPNGYDFLIRQVEYAIEPSGITTTLSLVPPEVFTGGRIVLPWTVAE